MAGDIPVFTRLHRGNGRINRTPQTLTPPSRVGSGLWTQATTKAPSSGPHTASLCRQSGQQPSPASLLIRGEKYPPAPQAPLCARTESHCVAHGNTCTYFSVASLAQHNPVPVCTQELRAARVPISGSRQTA